jgi:hypothetical protein
MVAQHDGVLVRVQLLPDVPRPLLLSAARGQAVSQTTVHMSRAFGGAAGASGRNTQQPRQLRHT